MLTTRGGGGGGGGGGREEVKGEGRGGGEEEGEGGGENQEQSKIQTPLHLRQLYILIHVLRLYSINCNNTLQDSSQEWQ